MAAYDVIVLGLGGMGSAAAAHLAARGQRVLGLERFGRRTTRGPATAGRGSSGSPTSRTRPTCRCCCAPTSCGTSWRPTPARPDDAHRRPLLRPAGQPDRGRQPACGPAVGPAARGARRRRDPAAVPDVDPADDEVGLYEEAAGFVRPEAHGGGAPGRWPARRGAELRFEEPVQEWAADGGRRRPGHHRGRHVHRRRAW